MANLIRYTPNRRGLRGVAKSRPVDEHLEGRAHRIAAAAQALYDARPPKTGHVEVEVVQADSDSDRARVAVIARHPAALPIEAKRRVLGGSLDAGR